MATSIHIQLIGSGEKIEIPTKKMLVWEQILTGTQAINGWLIINLNLENEKIL